MCKKNAAKISEKLKPFWGLVIFFNTQSVPNLSWRQAEEAKRKKKDLQSWSMSQWPTICGFLWICWLKKNVNFYRFCMHVFMDFFYFCVFYGFSDRIGIRRKKWTYGHGWWLQHVSSTVVDCPASFLGIGSTARSVEAENLTIGMIQNGGTNESYMSTKNPL